jgi:hypothetical protein
MIFSRHRVIMSCFIISLFCSLEAPISFIPSCNPAGVAGRHSYTGSEWRWADGDDAGETSHTGALVRAQKSKCGACNTWGMAREQPLRDGHESIHLISPSPPFYLIDLGRQQELAGAHMFPYS